MLSATIALNSIGDDGFVKVGISIVFGGELDGILVETVSLGGELDGTLVETVSLGGELDGTLVGTISVEVDCTASVCVVTGRVGRLFELLRHLSHIWLTVMR